MSATRWGYAASDRCVEVGFVQVEQGASGMKIRLIAIWDQWRNGFWFVPTLCCLVAVALGIVLPSLDAELKVQDIDGLKWLETTAASARTVLSTLAGVLVTVGGVVMSSTMVTLSLTTSQYGPRLLRNFIQNNITQLTIGIFLGVSLYCMLVLRAVEEPNGTVFVPHLSVATAVAGAGVAVAFLVYFIHYVVSAIQTQNVIWSVADELSDAIEALYPQSSSAEGVAKREPDRDPASEPVRRAVGDLRSRVEGYLQAVDLEGLLEAARERDVCFRLTTQPGRFVIRATAICVLERYTEDGNCPDEMRAELEAQLNRHLIVGRYRTPRQDIKCAILELVEVAVRALSPGINDPRTAIECVDQLGAAMNHLISRDSQPAEIRDRQGVVRIVRVPLHVDEVLDTAFQQIRQYGASSVSVTIRLVETLQSIAPEAVRSGHVQAIRRQAEMLTRSAERNLAEENDLADVRVRLMNLQRILNEHESAAKAAHEG
ncbi:MAG: DUF2254 domain-containing protein [Planctomycetaceae bacterium]|nr:DUF2254 domain-containing protein [Planctomycetaceae bacterium]